MAPKKIPSALKHRDFLTLLGNTKNKKRRNALIEVGTSGEIDGVSECILNILMGRVPLKPNQIRKLRKIKRYLRQLADKKCSLKKRKHILKQKGGFLGALIPIAVSALGSLFGGLIGKK
jgi:hypothetical protein